MAKRLLASLLLLISFSSFSYDTIVISDLDDTVKQTNVDRAGRALVNAVFTRKIFAGMPDLFQTMDTYTSDLYILSNSPNMFRFNIFKLLRKHNIAVTAVSTRNLIRDRDGFHYKYNFVVNKIKETDKKVILLGDDVGEDPEVYKKVKEDYPSKVAAIYIHKVKNREIPLVVTPYISVFDIAVKEYQAKRMNLNQATVLGDSVLFDYEMKKVIPKFSFCPKTTTFWGDNRVSELNDLDEFR
jgi:phosphatidate phosphatase APP1